MLDPKLKAEWVEALKSGKYKQTTSVLHDNKGYCCLGVLCEIANIPAWDGKNIEGIDEEGNKVMLSNYIPYNIMQDFSITDEDLSPLWRANDGIATHKHTFTEIADIIERNL